MWVVILIVIIIIAIYYFKTNNAENQQDANSKSKIKYTNECKITVVDNDELMIKILSLSEDDEKMVLHIQAQSKRYRSDEVHFGFCAESIDSLRTKIPKYYDAHDTNINYWHMEIPKKTRELFWISPDLLNMTKIDLNVYVYTWEPEFSYQNTIFEKTFSIYPYWKDKVTKFVKRIDESEVTIVDNEKIYLSVMCIEGDKSCRSVHISWFFVNKTDKELSLRLNEWEVNWMAINLHSTYYDLTGLPAWCSGYYSYYLAQNLKDLWLDSVNDIKTLKLILPKEITTRNKTIDTNKGMIIHIN